MTEERCYYVYMHTNIFNDKIYIGITKQEPDKRWNNGRGYRYNPYFCRAIKKYGWNNFKHEILFCNLTKTEACLLEMELIKYRKSTNSNFGYNIDNGGVCCGSRSEFTKDKISTTMKEKGLNIGKMNPMYGTRAINSKKIICLETKQIFNSIMEAGKKLDLDFRLISSVCNHKRNSTGGLHFLFLSEYDENFDYKLKTRDECKSKQVICLETGKIFKSIKECGIIMGINKNSINGVCKGRCKTAGGYHFKYYTE